MSKYHPRIYPANRPILGAYEHDHPAVRALQIHAQTCDACVGKEIDWPHVGNEPIEKKWFSKTRLKEQLFSAFAYEFLSYDLILDGWIEMAAEPTEAELNHLEEDEPLMRALLTECEEAAIADDNEKILPLVAQVRRFLQAYHEALLFRFQQCGIQWSAERHLD